MFNAHITAILTQIQHCKLNTLSCLYAVYCCRTLCATGIVVCFYFVLHLVPVTTTAAYYCIVVWCSLLIFCTTDDICADHTLIHCVCHIMYCVLFITTCLKHCHMSDVHNCMFTQQESHYLLYCSIHTSVRLLHSMTWLHFAEIVTISIVGSLTGLKKP